MKKNILVIITILLLSSFFGCKKYEEGPFLTLRSPYNRIEGQWSIEKYIVDEIDYSQLFKDSIGDYLVFELCYPGDGVDRNEIFTKNINGSWRFDDNLEKIYISIESSPSFNTYDCIEPFGKEITSIWEIRKLNNKEFRLETNFENKDYKLILKK
jgi:hypothetical protein